jgi:voltage-gated potassium channel
MHPTARPDATRVTRCEIRSEWPLAAVALLFLGAYAWPILDEGLAHPWRLACLWVGYAAWAVFVIDFVGRIILADQRAEYVWRHLLDLAVIALPILRPLRLLRLVVMLRVLNRRAEGSLHGRIAIYVGGSAGLLLFCASLAILDAERHHAGANIANFGDALWWSAVTATTVGYGDRFPVTAQGRFIAVGLMIGGIALLGTVTASIASWLINRVRQENEAVESVTRADLKILSDKIDDLSSLIAAMHVTPSDPVAVGLSPPNGT